MFVEKESEHEKSVGKDETKKKKKLGKCLINGIELKLYIISLFFFWTRA